MKADCRNREVGPSLYHTSVVRNCSNKSLTLTRRLRSIYTQGSTITSTSLSGRNMMSSRCQHRLRSYSELFRLRTRNQPLQINTSCCSQTYIWRKINRCRLTYLPLSTSRKRFSMPMVQKKWLSAAIRHSMNRSRSPGIWSARTQMSLHVFNRRSLQARWWWKRVIQQSRIYLNSPRSFVLLRTNFRVQKTTKDLPQSWTTS